MLNRPLLPPEVFSQACAALPLVSVDLYLTRHSPEGLQLLVGRRNNRPAKGWLFTPGGRIRKQEPLAEALRRVALDELGLSADCLSRARLLGAWDHFYSDSAFDEEISTHYVNLPYALRLHPDEAERLQPPTGPDEQHSDWMWIALQGAEAAEGLHPYVRETIRTVSSRLIV